MPHANINAIKTLMNEYNRLFEKSENLEDIYIVSNENRIENIETGIRRLKLNRRRLRDLKIKFETMMMCFKGFKPVNEKKYNDKINDIDELISSSNEFINDLHSRLELLKYKIIKPRKKST